MSEHSRELAGDFPSTHWSLVARAGGDDLQSQRKALGDLLTRYLPALRSHLVLRKRIPADRADDHLQSFLSSKVLEQGLIARAQREKGRFRSFLLVALDRFVISEVRHERAKKRRPDALVSLAEDPEMARWEPATDAAFDIDWARRLLAQAVSRMEAECKASARPDVWGIFKARILDPITGTGEEQSYESLVQQYGFTSPAQASNVLMTAKRTFIRVLRATIGEYEPNAQDIDAEIADLYKILQGAPA